MNSHKSDTLQHWVFTNVIVFRSPQLAQSMLVPRNIKNSVKSKPLFDVHLQYL